MSGPRPPLTDPHRRQLRTFVRLVDDMSRCDFVEWYRTNEQGVSFANGTTTAPVYDWDDFRSFLTVFRQVGISNNEPAYFTKVLKTVVLYASDDLRKDLGELRTHLVRLLGGRWTPMFLCQDSPTGEEMRVTPHQALLALVNGRIFHSDESHQETLDFLDSAERWFHLFPIVSFLIMPALRGFIWLFHALRRDGILEERDYPARCRSGTVSGPAGS